MPRIKKIFTAKSFDQKLLFSSEANENNNNLGT